VSVININKLPTVILLPNYETQTIMAAAYTRPIYALVLIKFSLGEGNLGRIYPGGGFNPCIQENSQQFVI